MTPKLEAKIKDVLARLALLSEASTSNLDPATSHGSPSSKAPAGTATSANLHAPRDPDRPPSKDRSLHDWYSWQFTRAVGEPQRLISLLTLAEREYMERTVFEARRIGLRKGELTENDVRDGGAAEREAAQRVIDCYQGMPAVEVAIFEYTTEEWVKKARRQLGRQPHDGLPRSEFLDLDEGGRRERAAALHALGLRLTTAAHRLRVDKNTVKRYWPLDDRLEAVA